MLLDPLRGQRLGRDHEGIHRHHAAPQPLRGLGRIAVGGHDHVSRPHRAARRRDAEAAPRALDGLHRAVAHDLRAVARGALQQAGMVEARVDRAVAAQDLAAVVAPFAVGRGCCLGLDHLRVHRDPVLPHHGEVVREAVEHALGGRRDEAPGVAIEAGDLLLLDQGRRVVMGGDRRAADLSGALPPELRHHLAVLVPDLAAEIAGVAGAGPVPCGLSIEHHRLPAPPRQSERGGKPHVPGAHDHRLRFRRRHGLLWLRPRREVPPVWRRLEIRRHHIAPRHRTLRTSASSKLGEARLCRSGTGG